jgi:hypothetical protein
VVSVAKFFIKWQLDPNRVPIDAKERAKAWLSMIEMVKEDMKAGTVKDWGTAAGGDWGYSVNEARSETELFTRLLKWIPYAHFEVTPVLTVDQTMESIKKAGATAKK